MTDEANSIPGLPPIPTLSAGTDNAQSTTESIPQTPAPADPIAIADPGFPQAEPIAVETVPAESPHIVTEQSSVTAPEFASAQSYQPAATVPDGDAPLDISAVESEHAHWLATDGKEGKRANFRGLDLTGMNLSGRHFMEASFRGATLTEVNFSGTDLRAADLSEAILDRANMRGAFLYGASLARAQLHQVQASGADMTTANFAGAIAESIHLNNAKMSGAILRDANFRHADFSQAVLRDANIRNATLVEANLTGADLTAADCRDVNFDRSIFSGAVLHQTNFRSAKLDGVDMQTTDFSVALDVATQFHALSLQSERAKIQEEQAQLASRESALIKEKERVNKQFSQMVATMESNQAQLAAKLRKLSIGFVIRFVLWLLIIAGVVACLIARMDDIDITRMAVILGAIAAVFLLALVSMLRSIQIARLLKKFSTEPVDGVPPVAESSAPAASVAPEPLLSSPPSVSNDKPKKSGFGFGKKNK